MSRIGVISNRASQRNRTGLSELRTQLAMHPEVDHGELNGIEGLRETLTDFAGNGIDLIVVNGGDGTVQAVITSLLNDGMFAALPTLAVLPGGMTNMIAHDIGAPRRPEAALRRLLSGRRPEIAKRRIIRLQGNGERPIYGMFFGTAAIVRGIEYCRRAVHPLKLESSTAAGAALAALLAKRIWRRGGEDKVFRGDGIAVGLDGAAPETDTYLIVLVTTLNRLVMRTRPFWGSGSGGLRYTALRYPPRQMWRRLPVLLYGGEARTLPPNDYISVNADDVLLDMACPYTLDGELFEASPRRPVRLSSGPELRFQPC